MMEVDLLKRWTEHPTRTEEVVSSPRALSPPWSLPPEDGWWAIIDPINVIDPPYLWCKDASNPWPGQNLLNTSLLRSHWLTTALRAIEKLETGNSEFDEAVENGKDENDEGYGDGNEEDVRHPSFKELHRCDHQLFGWRLAVERDRDATLTVG